MGFSFKNHGGSKITWGFGKSVGCTAFWWGIGGGMEIVVGYFFVGSVGGGRSTAPFLSYNGLESTIYAFRNKLVHDKQAKSIIDKDYL